ncbi:ABC transporter ATP-binding protein [Kribbella sandramycini]|uniref:ABC-type quaternary amine transporter n=1 Tax=Kribbella sandramycini TaxID=60450 RepID=A0A7Y4P0X2_9ACTN|nr:ABC transporter ATP-binding protein [Kribbella sandramycini]MBB6565240.1 osmoprotectant transport system ATP-binding protein [Kribbella sandramycini]NOL41509.1 ABC transporter ATP-binding protein [Kribbella sandramycini]
MIEFKDVTKRYPDGTVAVDNLSLRIPSHQITVFVGPSGCGKTTSLRMINRTIERSSGTISIDDEDINSQDAVQLRRGIGYVIQHAGLFPHKTVLDNVATVPKLLGWDKAKTRSTALELLERVGLDLKLADRYPAQLSGGQQQRVGVARALAADPKILLMDEPFSAVDPIVRNQLQEELLRLQRDIGKTMVFVTHDIDEAIKLGDNVAVLRVGGKLAQFAPPAELLANPVDEFVESFIGKDRGYRALTFVTADTLRLTDVPGELARAEDGTPKGWANGSGELEPVGATFQRGDSLRAALDAVLTSPVGKGVCVDEAGKVVGVVEYAALAEAIRA